MFGNYFSISCWWHPVVTMLMVMMMAISVSRWRPWRAPIFTPLYTWQLYVYVLSSAAYTPSRQQSQYAPDIWNWGRRLHQKEVRWEHRKREARSIMRTLVLQDVCNIVVCLNWGHERAVNKDFDSAPDEMKVEVKPFFSLFKSRGYSALIGCAW